MASTRTDSAGRPVAWKGREVEVVTAFDGDPAGWWFFQGEIEARNTAAARTGRPPLYHRTGTRLTHPVYAAVQGAEWRTA